MVFGGDVLIKGPLLGDVLGEVLGEDNEGTPPPGLERNFGDVDTRPAIEPLLKKLFIALTWA